MLKILLAPFALIYGFAVKVRNLLFDYRILKSTTVGRPTICVGNLTVGGTGKTPHVEYLVNLLATKHKVATLSRGYKRQTKGFLYADVDSTSQQVGDEPLQIKTKFPDAIVAVNGNRVEGAQRIIKDYPDIETIILDDAFQHRSIKPGFSILLMDFNNLVTKDYFLPVGRLRDSLKEIRRADIVVVTKCLVNIKPIDQRIITTELKLYPYQTIFFSWFEYGDPIPVFKDATSACKVIKSTTTIALAGIANPFPFFQHLEEQTTLVQKNAFPDHYPYSEKKIKAIFESLSGVDSNNKAIITTEKDAARLKNLEGLDESVKRSIFYIPIEVAFSGESAKDFNKKIEDYVRTSKRDYGLHTK